ncbi:D-Tyr tRNAtyr deacylase-like domain-containing protein [Lasiosphaeria ovina]|uniref:D-aminoacyl-tRNA deacylase n=1 Tax=Lasiosphaeria ovina TaxID=92902 RepID=A0AAE0NLX2_9PEZI|nr:D-Tyr tRNAtyr deacylase-like domain-containing protein [Lasiosphaeria ovina]
MKAILQRVLSASVTVEKELVSSIGKGVLVFAAMAPGDTQKDAEFMAAKVLKMRLWDDDEGGRVCLGQWKRSVQDINGEVLCVSQFTLLASTKKGTKPDFHGALGPEEARDLYQYFFSKVQEGYDAKKVKDGVFQAMMEVALVNDGPVRTLHITHLEPSLLTGIRSKVTLEISTNQGQASKKAGQPQPNIKSKDSP